MKYHLTLTGTAKTRLAKRKDSNDTVSPLMRHTGNWRDVPQYETSKASGINPASESGCRWIEDATRYFRFAGACHDIRNMNHDGWFVDNYQDETCHGVIYQLPSRKGVCQYYAGYNDTWNPDSAYIDFSQSFDTPKDASFTADSMAENHAEESREFYAKDSAEQRIEEAKQEIANLRRDTLSLILELRLTCATLKGFPSIKMALRRDISNLLEQRTNLYKEIESLRDNFWNAVPA